jgi:alpha-glucosidase
MKYINLFPSFLMIVTLCLMVSCNKTNSWTLLSHDEKIKVEVVLEMGKVFYTVSIKEEGDFNVVIQKSPLGIIRQDADFTKDLVFTGISEAKEIDEKYEVITGKKLKLHSRANELVIEFENTNKNKVQIIFRTFNDGIAFRYLFPEEKDGDFLVTGELTGFQFSEGKAWIQPYDDVTKWTPAYEAHYLNEVPIGQTSPLKNGWCFPALFHTSNTWVLLSEAGLDGNFYGAHLNPECANGLYTIRLPEEEEAMGVYERHAMSNKLPWASPWRVAIMGNHLNTIVQSNMVRHLSPANRLDDISWIKPGRASWSWLSDHDSPQDYDKLKKFVNLSVEMGWEYSLVDANWNIMKGGDIRQLVNYANSKNIGILLWYNSGGPHNIVEEMVRDLMHIPEKRQAEFAKLQKWGVKGVKIDFFQSDKQGMMELYKDILEDAAKYQMMVNFHGCAIPHGWSRTYPNLMTMESVRGAECYTFAPGYPQEAPVSNTILPVTRNVVGSMDYTPVLFSEMKMPHITSYGHELALSVLFESGLLHFADNVEAYQSLPDEPKYFLKNVPAVWDETEYLTGYPGNEMVLARRSGNTWYVAGVNGENVSKRLSVPLYFLSDGIHEAELITDGRTPRSFSGKQITVGKGIEEEINLLPYGGFVLKIEMQNDIK